MKKPLSALLFLVVLFTSFTVLAETINIFVAGVGGVGSELLTQIERKQRNFQSHNDLEIRVVAIGSSSLVLQNENGIELSSWKSRLSAGKEGASIVQEALLSSLPNKVFVDCTSNEKIAERYVKLLAAGISIVTASKKANSGSMSYYEALRAVSAKSGALFIYDANVGAGLPFITTTQMLCRSGEPVSKIEGVFSGTLSFLFNSFTNGVVFSNLVREAQRIGYTEPDPRDDLNGMDAARKLLILAREAGYKIEMSDVEIEPFLPETCFKAKNVEDFYIALAAYDQSMEALRLKAARDGKRLVYMASFTDGKAKLSLAAVDASHPFYHLSGCNNILSLTTPAYQKSPIVIMGPGAGTTVTADRVLEGIIRAGRQRSQSSKHNSATVVQDEGV